MGKRDGDEADGGGARKEGDKSKQKSNFAEPNSA